MSQFLIRRTALAACVAVSLGASGMAWSQSVQPDQSSTEAAEAETAPAATTAQTGAAEPAPSAAETASDAAQPATDTAQPAAGVGEPTTGAAETAAADTDTQAGASATVADEAEPVGEVPSVVTELAPAENTLPHDLSPWGMFMAADIVVKSVMIGLAFASVVTWTILLVKLLEIWGANRNARRSADLIARARDLDSAVAASAGRRDPASRMLRAASIEIGRSSPALANSGTDGLKERISSYLSSIVSFAGRQAGSGTGLLATIGSTAPFVGLFGTVWGIMNSFIGISESQTTNLAVVAPGIAEALLATALGLVAAIPAVVIYNYFARMITGYRMRLSEAAAGIERLVSRDIDFAETRRI